MAQNPDFTETLKQTTDRNRYFYGKLMTVRDFLQEQQYFNNKRWLVNRLLFGSGIVCGLEARWKGTGTTEIEIEPGVGFDQLGREITVPNSTRIDVRNLDIAPPQSGSQRRVHLCLAYHECPKEPVPSVKSSPCDEVCESNRLSETFTFELRDASEAPPAADMCAQWLNRRTEERHTGQLRIERTAPAWVRADEVFEVALKVTALADTTDPIRITEKETGEGTFIEPTPAPSGQVSQFPTPPVMLRAGEFFIYVYQMKAPPLTGSTTTKNITIINTTIPALTTTVEVIRDDAARRREVALRFGECGEKTVAGNACLPVATLKVHFSGSQIVSVSEFNELDVPRRYNLARVGQLLDCLRASLQAEAGSARPGHAFITFKDTERNAALPVSHTGRAGTSFTVARGDHTHALLLHESSGLEFPAGQDLLRINGDVGGDRINFLNNVSGQTPRLPEHLVTKSYVDGKVAGLDWQESVRTKELREPPATAKIIIDDPKRPRTPERYLLFHSDLRGAWEGHQNQIATREGAGDEWIFTVPDEATAVFVEAEKVAYLYVAATRNWTPFLATPELAAGNGLTAAGAFLSVGEGAGLYVSAEEVSVVYRERGMLPVGIEGAAGRTDQAARGDHTHELPLARSSGLEFIRDDIPDKDIELPDDKYERDFLRLRINGLVGGEAVEFEHPVSGQLPVLPRHFATKQYVDTKLAGLDWQESVRTKERTEPPPVGRFLDTEPEGGGDPRPEDDEKPSPIADEDRDAPFKPVPEFASPPIIKPPVLFARPGDRFLLFHDKLGGEWERHLYDIAILTAGPDATLAWTFFTPTEGTAVFVEDENVAYIFAEGKWSAFLAMPEVAAGNGLVSDGAALSVGAGAGLHVTEDEVSLAFESDARGVRPVGTTSDSGVAATVARGDHTHEFPLLAESGIEFRSMSADDKEADARPEDNPGGFRINGAIGGDRIVFRHPVAGAEPTEAQHLATKNYVDTAVAGLDWQASVLRADLASPPVEPAPKRGERFLILTEKPEGDWAEHAGHIAIKASRGWSYKEPDEGMAVFVEDRNISFLYADGKWTEFLAAPSPVTAGDGLVRREDTLAVGQGDGIIVNPGTVSLAYPENPPPPVGAPNLYDARRIGNATSVARSDHTHIVPLAAESGIEYVHESAGDGFRVNGTIGGRNISFLNPVAGQDPTLAQHLATKNYVDKKPVNIGAGSGLTRSGDTLSVKPGAGIGADANGVAVAYSNDAPRPLGVGSPGASNFASRGDHVHPLPERTTGTSSGVFDFSITEGQTFTADSGIIRLDKGVELFFVQVGLIIGGGRVVYGDIAGNARDRGYPPISLAAEVVPLDTRLGGGFGFRIVASSPEPLPTSFSVRYFVFRPFESFASTGNTNNI